MTVRFLTCDGVAPVRPPADTAVAGTPGTWEPYDSVPPTDIGGAGSVAPVPDTRWLPGDYIVTGDGSEIWWDGDSWEPGRATVDPCGPGTAPTISTILPNPVSAGGLVRITGAHFDKPNLDIMVASVAATYNLISATQVDVTIPPGTTPSNASVFVGTDCGSVNGNVVVN